MKFKLLVSIFLVLFSIGVFANPLLGSNVISYKSLDGNSQISLVRYGEKKEQTYLAYYQQLESDWDEKTILLHKGGSTIKTYYDEITPGKRIPKTFRSIVDFGKVSLINGSLVSEVEVTAKGLVGKPIKMYLSDVPLIPPQEILSHYSVNN